MEGAFYSVSNTIYNRAAGEELSLAELNEWKMKLRTAKCIVFIVATDLAHLSDTQIVLMTQMFEAMTAGDVRATFLLCGIGTFEPLPFRSIQHLSRLEFYTLGGWSGNLIYVTWFDLTEAISTMSYLHMAEMSPQEYNGLGANLFPSLLITCRGVLVISQLDGVFFKAKLSRFDQVGDVVAAVGAFYGEYVEIVMDDKTKSLFGRVWDGLFAAQLLRKFVELVVRDTGGVHDRNRLVVDETGLIGDLYDFVKFYKLPNYLLAYTLSLNDAYRRREAATNAFVKWLAGCDLMQHLVIKERIGVFQQVLIAVHVRRRKLANTWSQLQTVEAILLDDRLTLDYLVDLPATHVLRLAFWQMNMAPKLSTKATEDGWYGTGKPELYWPLTWVEYFNDKRRQTDSDTASYGYDDSSAAGATEYSTLGSQTGGSQASTSIRSQDTQAFDDSHSSGNGAGRTSSSNSGKPESIRSLSDLASQKARSLRNRSPRRAT